MGHLKRDPTVESYPKFRFEFFLWCSIGELLRGQQGLLLQPFVLLLLLLTKV